MKGYLHNLDELKSMIASVELEILERLNELESLRAENAKLKLDKQRLDWAAENKTGVLWNAGMCQWWSITAGFFVNRKTIRAAIDAAMK